MLNSIYVSTVILDLLIHLKETILLATICVSFTEILEYRLTIFDHTFLIHNCIYNFTS